MKTCRAIQIHPVRHRFLQLKTQFTRVLPHGKTRSGLSAAENRIYGLQSFPADSCFPYRKTGTPVRRRLLRLKNRFTRVLTLVKTRSGRQTKLHLSDPIYPVRQSTRLLSCKPVCRHTHHTCICPIRSKLRRRNLYAARR